MTRKFLAVACLLCSGHAHASWMAQCHETAEDKARNVIVWLTKNVNDAVPNIPPETEQYFFKEYSPAANAQSPGRYEALSSQPLFQAWQVRKTLRTLVGDLEFISVHPAPDGVYPYPSARQTNIYWAAGALSVLPSLQHEVDVYAAQQRSSRQPLAAPSALLQLETVTSIFSIKLNQIVECELDHTTSPDGPPLKTSNH